MKTLSPKRVRGSKRTRPRTTRDTKPLRRATSYDFSIHASEDGDHMERALSAKLDQIRKDKSVLRLKLNDFVELCTPQQFGQIKDFLLNADKRSWQSVKFCDTVRGCNYRRWLFKKGAIERRTELLQEEKPDLAVRFVTRVEISFDEMNLESISALLQSIQKDVDVTTIAFTGYVKQQDVEAIVEDIATLVGCDERIWEGIIFHPCFGGTGREYNLWNQTIKKYSRNLECLSTEYTIPVGVKILDARQ